MKLRAALTGILSLAVLASFPAAQAAKPESAAAVAGDAAAFEKLKAEIAHRNAQQDAVQAKRRLEDEHCKIKPVMTDAEIDACRHR